MTEENNRRFVGVGIRRGWLEIWDRKVEWDKERRRRGGGRGGGKRIDEREVEVEGRQRMVKGLEMDSNYSK